MTIVSTGFITITDNNDAKPISYEMTSSAGFQQVYDPTGGTYIPDWTVGAGVKITVRLYAGLTTGLTNITAAATTTNRKFFTDPSTATALIGTGAAISGSAQLSQYFVGTGTFTVVNDVAESSITFDANMLSTIASMPLYFSADYLDPSTGLTTKILASCSMGIVKTGTNAVFITFRGGDAIVKSDVVTSNKTAVSADLVRVGGIDTDNLLYKWYESIAGVMTQISTSTANYNIKYSTENSTAPANPIPGAADGSNIPVIGGSHANNTLTISEDAINKLGIYRVDITDTVELRTYSNYFSVKDIADPYAVTIFSPSGDKLQNGTGSMVLTPLVYRADVLIAATGWNFTWTFYDRNGKRAAFVDSAVSGFYNSGDGLLISANTGSATYTITHPACGTAAAAGKIVKVVKTDGTAIYYEVGSGSTTTSTVLKTSALAYLSLTDYPLPTVNALVGGRIFMCTTAGQRTGGSITVTGIDIDVKGNITVDADRP